MSQTLSVSHPLCVELLIPPCGAPGGVVSESDAIRFTSSVCRALHVERRGGVVSESDAIRFTSSVCRALIPMWTAEWLVSQTLSVSHPLCVELIPPWRSG